MEKKKQIFIYLIVAFVPAWLLQVLPIITGHFEFMSISLILCMVMPTIAVLAVQRFRWIDFINMAHLHIEWKKMWFYILLALIMPTIFSILGAVLYFLVWPNRFDITMTSFQQLMVFSSKSINVDPKMVVIAQIVQAMTIAAVMNLPFALGEEIGWRVYFTPLLSQIYGKKKALLFAGLIWGLWHAPLVIFGGYEYGWEYQFAPFSGVITICIFTFAIGTLFTWLFDKTGSAFVPALAHGSVNAIAGMPLYFLHMYPKHFLMGPTIAGAVGVLPTLLLAFYVWKKVN